MRRAVVVVFVLVAFFAQTASAATFAQLLRRHEPVLVLHPDDPVGPAFHDVWVDPLRTLARWPAG